MASEKAIIYGVFKTELKNRFLCLVNIAGSDVICYIPSSCRLSNFLDLTGRNVMLLPTSSSKARTAYSIYAVEYRGRYVPVKLSLANQVVEDGLHSRRFAYLKKRSSILREHTVEGYKSDFFIQDTQTIIEVKSILSFDRDARFPVVYTERGIQQLEKLSELLSMGYRVAYLFVALNSSTKSVSLSDEMLEYSSAFRQCIDKGMLSRAYSVKHAENGIFHLARSIPVNVDSKEMH